MESLTSFLQFLKPYKESLLNGYGIGIRKHTRKVTWLLRRDEITHIQGVLNGHLKALSIYDGAFPQYVDYLERYSVLADLRYRLRAASTASNGTQILTAITDVKSYIGLIFKRLETLPPISKFLGYPWESSAQDTVLLHDAIGRRILLPIMLMGSKRVGRGLLSNAEVKVDCSRISTKCYH